MQPVGFGLLATIGLLALYAGTMTALSGWQAAIEQFQALWYLMLPLAAGFGIQVGLYTKLRASIQKKTKASLVTGGVTAGASMLACCVHHTTDVLPFLGLSTASIFFIRYQTPILLISLGINLIGIIVMLGHVRRISV